jgi:uncharacterized phage protein (TIGR01671 family)
MKEFIFRAWDRKHKKMIYPPSRFSSSKGLTVSFDGCAYLDGYFQELEYLPWTGLIDVSGKKIYEGDILGGIWEGGYIKYCDACKNLQYHAGEECFACLGDLHWAELVEDDGKLEVIGNIFEDKELLA